MRAVLAASVLSLCAVGNANDLPAARSAVAEAFGVMAAQPQMTVQMNGFETLRGNRIPVRVSLAISRPTGLAVPTVFLEMTVYRGGALSHRLAGDGRMLWRWEESTKTYSSTEYQNADQPRTDFLRRLILQTQRWAPTEADFAIRLMRDALLGGDNISQWSPWIPNAAVRLQSSPEGVWVRCDAPETGSNLSYLLDNSGSQFQLSRAEYRRVQNVRGRKEETVWTASVFLNQLPHDSDFGFVAPKGSRPRVIGPG